MENIQDNVGKWDQDLLQVRFKPAFFHMSTMINMSVLEHLLATTLWC